MPAVASGKVLVTGANGYVATWLVKTLLDHGYSVRGTVRSESKAAHLKETFKAYGDKVETAIVDDISKEGAFDEAVKGVDAIAHTASPCHLDADDPQEIIGPAVGGTTGILHSALKFAPTVKRIVVTSSCGTILQPGPEPSYYTAEDWATSPVKEVEEKGRNAHQHDKYCASKILAERAVWAFWETYKGKAHFEVTTLLGPHIFGPPYEVPKDKSGLSASMQLWLDSVLAATDRTSGHEWLDVRDFALAHVLAIQKEAAGGERIIVAAGTWKWQDWINAARAIEPRLPEGDTSYNHDTAVHLSNYDHSKAERLLGLKPRTIAETTKDVITVFQSKGWVP